MNFNDDDSILYPDDSRRPPPIGNLIPGFPTPGPGAGPGAGPGPGGNFPFPGSPGAPPMGSNLNIGPPPNFTPSKSSPGVQTLSGGPQTKAVSPGSISFCLFKFTYIWETSGRNYWAFLLNVDRRSVSGLRWFRRSWVFFGLDLRRIASFICYRSDSKCDLDSKDDSENDSQDDSTLEPLTNNRKIYSANGIKNTYTRVLTSIEIPEIKNDYIINYIGEVDGNELTTKIPCKQARITNYRIVLELTYPDEFNKQLIDKINSCAVDASNVASRYLDEFRDSKNFLTPLEVFNSSTKQIGKSLKAFSTEFTTKLKKLKLPREVTKEIEYTILQEKVEEPWRII